MKFELLLNLLGRDKRDPIGVGFELKKFGHSNISL
jgi:hypothetical protein